MIRSFTYVRPKTLDEAVSLAAKPGARVHSGGTDLLGCLRDEVFDAREVVSLSLLTELKGISVESGGVRIGALTTLAHVAAEAAIATRYRALKEGAASAAFR